jgi:hypothetical protein
MKRLWPCLVFPLLASSAFAKKQNAQATCETQFTVVREDALRNITQGLSRKQGEWYQKKIQKKKYADVCYAAPDSDVPLVFFITVTPAVYHGTYIDTQTETHHSPVDATATDQDGNQYDVDGTVTTRSTTSTAVPYSVNYGIYTLTVETREGPHEWKARRRFRQRGLYGRIYGIPVGKGRHPVRAVVEEAARWVHEGGLANPLESIAPSQ